MSGAEVKTCQSCRGKFTIEPEDFAFYEKMKVPPPTWCAECRLIRRMSWRNDWHLFKKKDARTGEPIFSFIPEEAPIKVYEREYWLSDAWDPLAYGQDIDWDRPFLEQFRDLLRQVPEPALSVQGLSNCEYCMNASYSKNCYFSRGLTYTEDCAYVIWDNASKRCMDSHMTDRCELSYGNVNCTRCYKTLFSVNCEDCQNVVLSRDCVGCNDCFGCIGLRKKSNYIFNRPYSKEEYRAKLAGMKTGSYRNFQTQEKQAREIWLSFPVKYMEGLQNSNVSGDFIYNSKNAQSCYRVKEVEDSKYCMNILLGPVRNCYDCANWGMSMELMYECLVAGDHNYNLKFCHQTYPSNKNLEYCIFCSGSSDLFGCISLKKKQFCILNKQYSEEEYRKILPRLIEHMSRMPYRDKKGREYRYGEFFPAEFSPIPYNCTAAHEFFPKTQQEALAEGLLWKDQDRSHEPTLAASDLPDEVADANPRILKEIIPCAHMGSCAHECTGAFRVIEQELEFLKEFGVYLPRLCPNCRHGERLKLRNNPRFYESRCRCAGKASESGTYVNTAEHFHRSGSCPNLFETSYAPGRPEIVYCEQCYKEEVA